MTLSRPMLLALARSWNGQPGPIVHACCDEGVSKEECAGLLNAIIAAAEESGRSVELAPVSDAFSSAGRGSTEDYAAEVVALVPDRYR